MEKPTLAGLVFGLFFVAIGAGTMLALVLWPGGLKSELWVAEIAASAFVFAGLSFVARAVGYKIVSVIFSLAVVFTLGFVALYFLF